MEAGARSRGVGDGSAASMDVSTLQSPNATPTALRYSTDAASLSGRLPSSSVSSTTTNAASLQTLSGSGLPMLPPLAGATRVGSVVALCPRRRRRGAATTGCHLRLSSPPSPLLARRPATETARRRRYLAPPAHVRGQRPLLLRAVVTGRGWPCVATRQCRGISRLQRPCGRWRRTVDTSSLCHQTLAATHGRRFCCCLPSPKLIAALPGLSTWILCAAGGGNLGGSAPHLPPGDVADPGPVRLAPTAPV